MWRARYLKRIAEREKTEPQRSQKSRTKTRCPLCSLWLRLLNVGSFVFIAFAEQVGSADAGSL